MRTAIAVVLVGVFALWAAASAISQIRRPGVRRLRRFDVLGLVPVWNLFGPRPIVSDYFVSYRAWDEAGQEVHDWRRLPLPGRRRVLDAVMNTRRRARKAQWGSANYLLSLRRPPVTTPSYLLLLGAVTRDARRDEAAYTVQFRVECVAGHYSEQPRRIGAYESERHLV
ncbi:MAG: hypothetical protein HOU81_12925 [Hamadaea sp.]|uniref:hypothetical protein n=1 Tax=Hamadaea sp. TaxID=2024425 RepID=UPI0017DA0193|nr:hypothetical protein [Hamadaea sp.]NUR71718.1 hypothetical protein [Hamadaea sp.]NUT19032.1 hypothetical protein [Hamadaea sp.]